MWAFLTVCTEECNDIWEHMRDSIQWKSFPHHAVNGLWLVLSDALALGYPTLMCSAQCFMLHSDRAPFRKCLVCAQDHVLTHTQKLFVWSGFILSGLEKKEKATDQNKDKLQYATANMLQDSWMYQKGILPANWNCLEGYWKCYLMAFKRTNRKKAKAPL